MKIIIYLFYYLIQFTWGILQNLIGFIIFIKEHKTKIEFYNGSFVGLHNNLWGGISLGVFILISGNKDNNWIKNTKVHEYGHSIQSLILGPLYLFIIGIPSIIWCNSKKYIKLRKENCISYFSFYPERWANYLGEKVTKQKITE